MEIRVIQQNCCRCKRTRAYDWEPGFNYAENLSRQGWRKSRGRWLCPACVNKQNDPMEVD